MIEQNLGIEGAYLVKHEIFTDERGTFREWFKASQTKNIAPLFSVHQANYSNSKKWVIRGIHYSIPPHNQAKIVTCASGEVMDVLVDLRTGSGTFLNIEYIQLSEDSGNAVYIPSGVGHGFLVKSEKGTVVYLTSSEYKPEYEKSIHPLDAQLGINWQIEKGKQAILSQNDENSPTLFQAINMGYLPKF